MHIGVLGTGTVGRTLSQALVDRGHEVRMGARAAGNETAVEWAEAAGPLASEGSFADAVAFGDMAFNATAGAHSLEALEMAGAEQLAGKLLVDVSNPLDFSRGMPPTLTVCNDDSLGEQLQRAFPEARIVKALNTVTAAVMVQPDLLPGTHTIFVCGDDAGAKEQAGRLLQEFGWPADSILDLGDIGAARGMEMYLLLWLRLWGATGSPLLNVDVRVPADE
ncbi:MAG: 8-hydroxy-5-deazaflavin:NADPH oxidoreductase [Solirubrobacteraceae bacterium]|jgi:predicted dinucleotide-binding enzyme|nr:8-hydroxy-5-deazaflavin:NADPH oxidoreductase [Solirubrobacteraceae bacterium]